MRALFNEIEKKRKRLEAVKNRNQPWIHKSDDLDVDRQSAQKKIEETVQRRKDTLERKYETVVASIGKRGRRDAASDSTCLPIPEDAYDEDACAKQEASIPYDVIIRGLRKYKQPIMIFGESRAQILKRLCDLEERKGVSRCQEETFIDTLTDRECSRSLGEIPDIDSILKRCRNVNEKTKSGRICTWIAKVLVSFQDAYIKDSRKSRLEGNLAAAKRKEAILNQTTTSLLPLLEMLDTQTLDEDILNKIHSVVEYCEASDYVKAHDAYMRLAIGNAAWPMGVTMVGIHERAGRSKIFTSEVAHILNDETTRKYIQMIKRLLSFAQSMAMEDPSRLVQMSNMN